MPLRKIIENHWYKKTSVILSILLFPLSLLFWCIVQIRKCLYKYNILKSFKMPVPVVIIGNITVGGSGKTPLTIYLMEELAKREIKTGIVLRGYKGSAKESQIVKKSDPSQLVGDEAHLYATLGCRVAIGANRVHACNVLLAEYPDIAVILADDGLQHYALKRDYEIVVIDGNRLFGNGYMLPQGPMRESKSRLKQLPAIILNSGTTLKQSYLLAPYQNKLSRAHASLREIYNPVLNETISVNQLTNKKIIALAAIGNPERFFEYLNNTLKIVSDQNIAFPDHYRFQKSDIPQHCEIILVTEKDYTKLAHFANSKIWVVKVNLSLNSNTIVNDIVNLAIRSK